MTRVFLGVLVVLQAAAQLNVLGQTTHPAIVLYTPGASIRQGEPLNVVIEVRNDSKEARRVSNLVEVVRVVARPTQLSAVPVVPDETGPTSETELRLRIECEIPVGGSGRRYLQISPKHEKARLVTIDAGQSTFLKIEVPADAFNVGQCHIVVKGSGEFTLSSQSVDIQCTEKPGN